MGNMFLPKKQEAYAYYERDVGGDDRSSATAAFNIQAKETNSRLESSGFKLDSKEEETKRLSDALSSFSYDSTGGGNKRNNNTYKSSSNGNYRSSSSTSFSAS